MNDDFATFESITVKPLAGALGAVIEDVDLSGELSNSVFDEIHRAFLRYQVISFPDQRLTPDSQVAFARRFGPIMPYPYGGGIEENPDVLEIIKNPEDPHNFGGVWHSDTTYLKTPPLGTMLIAREAPKNGGDTLFVSTTAAYDALSDGMKRTLARLRGINTAAKRAIGGSRAAYLGKITSVRIEDPDDIDTESIHPVVRTHPETGLKAIYVNQAHTVGFEELSREESEPILDFLYEHLKRPEFSCRVEWKENTLTLWDNRWTQHFAVNDYPGQRRVMHRVTIEGDQPQ